MPCAPSTACCLNLSLGGDLRFPVVFHTRFFQHIAQRHILLQALCRRGFAVRACFALQGRYDHGITWLAGQLEQHFLAFGEGLIGHRVLAH